MRTWKKPVLGRTICAETERLDEGWDVSVTGGDRTHIGAVTMAGLEGEGQTLERPGHRDGIVSRRWAAALAEAWGGPVCVCCGIHFDNATPTDLAHILAACDELLDTVKNADLME